MDMAGNAADEIVKISLNATEVALRVAGEGAKELAVLLYTILSQQKKTKGKARLESMLRSGKELKVFAVKEADLKTFAMEAKRYGVLYCVLRNSKGAPDSLCDIMVRAEDAAKINRIVERFQLATVDTASIRRNIDSQRERKVLKTHNAEHTERKESSVSEKEPTERNESNNKATELLNDLLGVSASKATSKTKESGGKEGNLSGPKTESDPPSGPISDRHKDFQKDSIKIDLRKPSVHKELEYIKATRNRSSKSDLDRTKIQYGSSRGSKQRQRVRERHK